MYAFLLKVFLYVSETIMRIIVNNSSCVDQQTVESLYLCIPRSQTYDPWYPCNQKNAIVPNLVKEFTEHALLQNYQRCKEKCMSISSPDKNQEEGLS